MQRTAKLFNRSTASSPALGSNAYPAALSSALGEEMVGHPCLHDTYPATVKVTRGASGVTSKLKFQGTSDFPDSILLGNGAAQISLFALSAGRSIQTVRGTTPGTLTSHVTDSTSLLTTITMSLDAQSRDADTANDIYVYITANLSALFTPAVVGAGTGIFGAMVRARDAPEAPRWADIESTREDTQTTVAEHTVDAGVGVTATLAFLVKTGGWRAIRCLATATAAPQTDDAVLVTMGLPG